MDSKKLPVIIAGLTINGCGTTPYPYNQDMFICRMPNGRYGVMYWRGDWLDPVLLWTSKRWPKHIKLGEVCHLSDPYIYGYVTKSSLKS